MKNQKCNQKNQINNSKLVLTKIKICKLEKLNSIKGGTRMTWPTYTVH